MGLLLGSQRANVRRKRPRSRPLPHRTELAPDFLLRIWRELLTYAEAAEDAVEDVIGDDGADDLAQLVEGEAQVDRDELVAAADEEDVGGVAEGPAGTDEALAAAGAG